MLPVPKPATEAMAPARVAATVISVSKIMLNLSALLLRSDKPRGNLNTSPKLIRSVCRHLVACVQSSKYFHQVIHPDTSSHVHPFGPVICDADNKCAFEIACHS